MDGVSSPLLEAGPEDASEAVVFVHGNPGSSSDWTELLDATGEFARVVAVDMPGFGKSETPRDFDFEVPAYGEFLQGALCELGIERVHLVLHDFGGPFGLWWGLEHPEGWASVVLINVGILPGYSWHTMAKRWRRPVIGELTQAWIPRSGWRRVMQKSNPKGLPEWFVDKMYDDYDRGTRRAVLKLYRSTPDPAITSAEVGTRSAELHRPALVVWGAKDPYLPIDYADRQREFFDVQDVVILPDSGHWPFQDDPAAVAQATLPFLRGQLTAASAV